MKISEMIKSLTQIKNKIGDSEVLISDGYEGHFYRGNYEIAIYEDDDGTNVVDIGVGGCKE